MTRDEFVRNVRSLEGRSYMETDCMGVVSQALGIRCQGTNWLWRSINNASKYRYLIRRSENLDEAKPGSILFRIKWDSIPKGYNDKPNCHHCGVLVNANTVIQSNPQPGVYSSRFDPNQWDAWGWMKQVDEPQENPSHDLPFDDPPLEAPDYSKMSNRDLLIKIYEKLFFED